MVNYYYVEEKLHNSSIGNYTAYAITAYKEESNKKTRIAYISDVFLDEAFAKHFIHICNTMNVDPVHLPDLIEEALINNNNLANFTIKWYSITDA